MDQWNLVIANFLMTSGFPVQMEYHGVAISNDTRVAWNSMEYVMEFHGTLTEPNQMSPSSME